MVEMTAQGLTVDAGGKRLLSNAGFALKGGDLTAVLGPNGAGKSTLVRAALGLMPAVAGSAVIDGHDVPRLGSMERARLISYLPQARPLAWPASVRDVIALGRYAHGVTVGNLKGTDAAAVERALEACDLLGLADRATDTLSGGELARVHCARAFAADTPLLIADEPVAALDPRHQFQVMETIRRYADTGKGALVILHDVALAARFADRLVWMKDGTILAEGTVDETLNEKRMEQVYSIRSRIVRDEDGTAVHILGPA